MDDIAAHDTEPSEGESALKVRFLGLAFDPHRLIYATIILLAALSIYDDSVPEEFTSMTALTLSAVLIRSSRCRWPMPSQTRSTCRSS